jgi:hypothetical protein
MSSPCPRHWSLKQRLQHRTIRDPKTGCILWTGSRTTNGYGGLNFGGRHWQAHRASWIVNRGPIPQGLLVCHRCDVRTCINPDHLFLGSQKENMADKVAKQGHERRTEEGPERRPSKSPEILRLEMFGREFVTRVLAIRPLDAAAHRRAPWDTRPRRRAASAGASRAPRETARKAR